MPRVFPGCRQGAGPFRGQDPPGLGLAPQEGQQAWDMLGAVGDDGLIELLGPHMHHTLQDQGALAIGEGDLREIRGWFSARKAR